MGWIFSLIIERSYFGKGKCAFSFFHSLSFKYSNTVFHQGGKSKEKL